ncbi:hypothetical protein J2S43_001044 [Catenuloplanes nepalensis]|uniref:Uncharacterized protein n=1 Tax=Catenuloplanes nepalensis TaxID=587533 RepID=A0ABT9MM76_9ACTN|nr:hypothetical protein [Catenuloplanes nepalensis]MDP9792532.1 hypothetical protein [Catenuloplanes nepalensis]
MRGVDRRRLQAVEEASGPPPAAVPAVHLSVDADMHLRRSALERLRLMNTLHARHAWEKRHADPIAAYGLALLYVAADDDHGRRGVKAATKLWLAEPKTADLPRLLYGLTLAVQAQAGNAGYDPRQELATSTDKMDDGARYVGLGVSSLDTHSGTWDQVQNRVSRYTDVPGTVRVVLGTDTAIVADRRGLDEFNTWTVHTTHALSASIADAPFPYGSVTPAQLEDDPAHGLVLRWMRELHFAFWRADVARLEAAQRAQQVAAHRRRP